MSTSDRLQGSSQFTTWQGIPDLDQQTPSHNKKNTPVASLCGGDVVRNHHAVLWHQAIMSPEIQGLEVPKVVRNVFYGKKVALYIICMLAIILLDRPVSPHHLSKYWLNNPTWVGMLCKLSILACISLLLDVL